MNKDGKIRTWYSWPVIIIMLCIFWPVGLFLLIKRLSLTKKASLVSARIAGILGAISYAIAALGVIACLLNEMTAQDAECIFFFAVVGFALRRAARNGKKEVEDVKKYLSVILDGRICRLDSIAAAVGKSPDMVQVDIQKMIRKGYLKNAFLNENTRELILPDMVSVVTPAANNTEYTPVRTFSADTRPVGRMVTCPCCGANNTIYGASGECEYCGSVLK